MCVMQEIHLEQPKASPRRWVMRLLAMAPLVAALLFLSAAALKVHYLRNYPISEDGIFHSRRFGILLLEVELWTAMLLVYPPTRTVAAAASMALLTAFTAYNLVLWSKGVETCGCLGVLSTQPSFMALIDGSLLLALIGWMRHVRHPAVAMSGWRLRPASLLTGMTALMFIAFVLARQPVRASEIPEGIELRPQVIDLGDVNPNSTRSGEFTIVNRRDSNLTITSVLTGCSCTTTAVTTPVLAPGEEVRIGVTYRAGSSASPINGLILVNVNSASGTEAIPVYLRANVVNDSRLLVFPRVIDLGVMAKGAIVQRIIYFRGSAAALAIVPQTIDVYPGDSLIEFKGDFGSAGGPSHLKPVELAFHAPTEGEPADRTIRLRFVDTGRAAQTEVNAVVLARSTPNVVITPSRPVLFVGDPKLPSELVVTVASLAGQQIDAGSIDYDLPLSVEPLPNFTRQEIKLKLSVDRAKLVDQRDSEGQLFLSDKASKSTIVIPVSVINLEQPPG